MGFQFAYTVMIAGLLATAQAASAGEAMPKVLVTVPAVTPYVDELLHGITKSQDLLRPGQDAHSFTLSSRQRHALAEADIIVIADNGMSPFLSKMLDAEVKRGATLIALTALKGAEPLPYTEHNPWLDKAKKQAGVTATDNDDAHDHDHEDEDEHEHVGIDPHLWLDPIRMAALATPLADAIAARSPSHRAQLEANATALATHLREQVDPALRALFAKHAARDSMRARPVVPFITYHAAYQYFLGRYGLEHYGELVQRPEEYLGAATLRNTLARADRVTMHCVIAESDSPLVKRVAKATSAKIITLSPESAVTQTELPSADWVRNDYDRLLQKTAESFAGCL